MNPPNQVPEAQLEQVRDVLFGSDLADLRMRLGELEELRSRVETLEASLLLAEGRTEAVSEVLVSAVEQNERPKGDLGTALKPEVEHAVFVSARDDSDVLANALYPVLGPAIRKMIANMFSLESDDSGAFQVEQILLIERESGLLLAAANDSDEALEDADIVSGMLDAIRLFMQDAFQTPEHDGLQDLRVGDTSVLVEWGPDAVLASITKGIPTSDYRDRATKTLESIHAKHTLAFANFGGDAEPFVGAIQPMQELLRIGQPAKSRSGVIRLLLVALIIIALVTAVVLIF